jgi:hypothetical protein
VVVYGLVLGNMVQRACGRCFAACESGIDAKIPDRVIAPTDGPTGSLAVGGALFVRAHRCRALGAVGAQGSVSLA